MRTFLLGTDWWTDCDDVVALRILARAVKNHQIQLAGIGINACMEYSVSSVDGFLNTEGLHSERIPLGIDRSATDFGGCPPYQKRLSQEAVSYLSNNDAEDAVRLYRKALSSAESKIEIIEIGFLQVIADVLESEKDDICDLSGLALVKEKVSKIWVMAGKWDEDGGKENNFARNLRARQAAHDFCEMCPVPVTFLGFEAGEDVISGSGLNKNDILYQVMCDHGSRNGRSSWDPMLVSMAIAGDEECAGYRVVCGTASVDAATGENHFTVHDGGQHKFVVRRYEPDYYANMINALIK